MNWCSWLIKWKTILYKVLAFHWCGVIYTTIASCSNNAPVNVNPQGFQAAQGILKKVSQLTHVTWTCFCKDVFWCDSDTSDRNMSLLSELGGDSDSEISENWALSHTLALMSQNLTPLHSCHKISHPCTHVTKYHTLALMSQNITLLYWSLCCSPFYDGLTCTNSLTRNMIKSCECAHQQVQKLQK